MKLHIVNYQLRLLLLSLGKPVENSDTTLCNLKESTSQNTPVRKYRI